MKKFIFFAFAAVFGLGASAQSRTDRLNEGGFYRVQNVGTGRYAYVSDCTGKVNYNTTTADMGAIALYDADAHDRFCDPASVCYITSFAHKHDVFGQNISLHGVLDHYVQFQDAPNDYFYVTPLVTIKGEKTNIYLKDGVKANYGYKESYVQGYDNETLTEYHQWKLIPVDNNTEYLGVKPAANMKAADKYYKPYVVGFDMKLSAGMKAYTVSEVKEDAVIIAPLEGIIPANTPVILECSSADASVNRVELQYNSTPASVSGNMLSANYFCYGEHGATGYNRYNMETMRVLAVEDGLLKYVQDNNHEHTTALTVYDVYGESHYDCISANESYLDLEEGAPVSLPVMTEAEYAAWKNDGAETTFPDIKVDNELNLKDANLPEGIAAMILEQIPAKYHADVNRNGRVSVGDLCKLIDMLIKNQSLEDNAEPTVVDIPLTSWNGTVEDVNYVMWSFNSSSKIAELYGDGSSTSTWGTLQISSEKEIVKVEMTCDRAPVDVYEVENKEGEMGYNGMNAVWAGSAKALTFTAPVLEVNQDGIKVSAIKVYLK